MLVRPVSSLGWDLRGALATGRVMRLTLSDRCDGIIPTADGSRILEGRIERVSATDAYCVVRGRHVPLDAILSISRTHFSQGSASDPSDPLEREAEVERVRLGPGRAAGRSKFQRQQR